MTKQRLQYEIDILKLKLQSQEELTEMYRRDISRLGNLFKDTVAHLSKKCQNDKEQ